MIEKNIKSKEHCLSTAVKEMALSVCFFTKAEINIIEICADQNNSEDLKNAVEEYKKTVQENPDRVVYLKCLNPVVLLNSYSPTYQFPLSDRPRDFARTILTKLKRLGLVEPNLPEDLWLSIFGYDTLNTKPNKIKWLGTKEDLRKFLALWFEKELAIKKIKFFKIKKLVPLCFFDKKGNPMYLANAREEFGPIPGALESFFRPNSNNA